MNDTIKTMFSQLGGHMAIVMLGARALYDNSTNSLTVNNIKGAKGRISAFVLSYNAGSDTYSITFHKGKGVNMTPTASMSDIYAEDLRRIVESETGLYLSL
jgi:hypothetical protein